MKVTTDEFDQQRHNTYLDSIIAHCEPLSNAMLAMGKAARHAAPRLAPADCSTASEAMQHVSDQAAAFLAEIADTGCPVYLRGADSQLQEALKLVIHAGRRGAEAARDREAVRLMSAASEIETANNDIVAAAHRISGWRNGDARA